MASINRPNHVCQNPHCGSTWYKPDYDFVDGKSVPVWRCVNCPYTEPRQTRYRRTNNRRAIDARQDLKQAWTDVDAQLALMVDLGHPNGCVLAYGSSFNYHMDKLLGLNLGKDENLSNFEVKHHTQRAQEDLRDAQVFVSKYAKIAFA